MALIEFQNLPNTSTPLNAENLNNNYNLLSNQITIYSSSTISVTTTAENEYTKIILPTVLSSVGDKLTYNTTTGEITVGSGVSYISVSVGASLQLQTAGMSYQRLWISKNNSRYGAAIQFRNANYTTNDYMPMTLSNILIPVSSGDKITIEFFNRTVGTYSLVYPYISVKVVQ